MATTKDNPSAPPEGVSPEQRAAMDAYITELSQLKTTPPPAPPERPAPVSDDEWGTMTDRQRENWVSSEVGWTLQQLAKLDADRRRDAEIEELKNRKPEPEGTPQEKMPTLLQKLQKFLWGEQDKP
jgi:hypothetical protein